VTIHSDEAPITPREPALSRLALGVERVEEATARVDEHILDGQSKEQAFHEGVEARLDELKRQLFCVGAAQLARITAVEATVRSVQADIEISKLETLGGLAALDIGQKQLRIDVEKTRAMFEGAAERMAAFTGSKDPKADVAEDIRTRAQLDSLTTELEAAREQKRSAEEQAREAQKRVFESELVAERARVAAEERTRIAQQERQSMTEAQREERAEAREVRKERREDWRFTWRQAVAIVVALLSAAGAAYLAGRAAVPRPAPTLEAPR
jgi:DNA-directed RNA polymerase beta' subunit